MVNIKHVQQHNNGIEWKCGAAVLEMVLSLFGYNMDQEEIWKSIKEKRSNSYEYFTTTNRIISYSIEAQLFATAYRANRELLSRVLDEIDSDRIPAILNVTQDSGAGHYIVYCGKKYGGYYFCDPLKDSGPQKVELHRIKTKWQSSLKNGESTGCIFIVFDKTVESTITCRTCEMEIPMVCDKYKKMSTGIICPCCNQETNLGTF